MKRRAICPLSIAALSFAILLPASSLPAFAQPSTNQSQTAPRGEHEAMRMVPARAALIGNLISNKVKPGDEFRASLANKVRLDNGPELPAGTILIGQVATDDMNESGTSKLALRFTEAKLKDGKTVPIKATIVGIMQSGYADEDNYRMNPGDQLPNSWNDGTLAVDQIDALHGVDLHSKIASTNSGVFVSSTNDHMKLSSGSELELAIAEQPQSMQPMSGMSNMHNSSNQQ